MMWCALVFMAFVAAAQAGPTCVHCDKAREGESKCNTQFLAEGNSLLHCGNNEVCTTDVRCDGKGRVLWIKGCESKNGITAMNTNICNDDNTRCRHHCDGDMCNQFAPADLVPTLACTPPGTCSTGPCSCTCTCEPCDDHVHNKPPTIKPPTIKPLPVTTVCVARPMDVVFVADSSRSINNQNPGNWDKVLNFLQGVLTALPISDDEINIGLVRFSGKDDTYKALDLTMNHKPTVLATAAALQYVFTSSKTKTDLGLKGARKILENHNRGVPIVIVIVTDGRTSSPVGTQTEMDLLKAMDDVTIIPVGVGGINHAELLNLSSGASPPYYHVDNFDELKSVMGPLLDNMCQ